MSKRKTPTRPLLSNKARSALRRVEINRMLAAGHEAVTVAPLFALDPPRRRLITGMANPLAALAREVRQVVKARAANPRQAEDDYIEGTEYLLSESERLLKDAEGSERRLVLDQIADFRWRLAQMRGGDGLLPPEHRRPGPAPRSPQDRPAGRKRSKAGAKRSKAGRLP